MTLLKPLINVDDHATKLTLVNNEDGTLREIWVTCSCGSRWSFDSKTSHESMQSIYDSHIRYFNRKTEVL